MLPGGRLAVDIASGKGYDAESGSSAICADKGGFRGVINTPARASARKHVVIVSQSQHRGRIMRTCQ